METMTKLWLGDTTSSPLLLLLLSFASVSTNCFCFPAAFEMMKELRRWWRRWLDLFWLDFWVVLFLQERRQWLFLCFSLLFYVNLCFFFPVFALFPLLFFLYVLGFSSLVFSSGFSLSFLLPCLCSTLPFIRPKSLKNHSLHERDRGRRHGHDLDRMHCGFPCWVGCHPRETDGMMNNIATTPFDYFQFGP